MQFEFKQTAGQIVAAFKYSQDVLATAATNTIKTTGDSIKKDGRSAIAGGGLGKKWQNAFRVNVYPVKGTSIDAALLAYHNIAYARVFEDGATIQGSPLLWLPLPAAPAKVGGRRVTAGNYRELIGSPLHTIKRPGKRPLLAAYVTGQRPRKGRNATVGKLRAGALAARKQQAVAAFGGRNKRVELISLPLFVGVPSVHIKSRFNLTRIFQKAVTGLPATYTKALEAAKAKD